MEKEGLVVAPGGLFEGTVEYKKPVAVEEEMTDQPERSFGLTLAG